MCVLRYGSTTAQIKVLPYLRHKSCLFAFFETKDYLYKILARMRRHMSEGIYSSSESKNTFFFFFPMKISQVILCSLSVFFKFAQRIQKQSLNWSDVSCPKTGYSLDKKGPEKQSHIYSQSYECRKIRVIALVRVYQHNSKNNSTNLV